MELHRSNGQTGPNDAPTDISWGSSAAPTARTRLFEYRTLVGREFEFMSQASEFWPISYAIVGGMHH